MSDKSFRTGFGRRALSQSKPLPTENTILYVCDTGHVHILSGDGADVKIDIELTPFEAESLVRGLYDAAQEAKEVDS